MNGWRRWFDLLLLMWTPSSINRCYTRFPISYYLHEHSSTCTASNFSSSSAAASGRLASHDTDSLNRHSGGNFVGNDDTFIDTVRPHNRKLTAAKLIAAMRRNDHSSGGNGSGSSGGISFQLGRETIATKDGIALMNHSSNTSNSSHNGSLVNQKNETTKSASAGNNNDTSTPSTSLASTPAAAVDPSTPPSIEPTTPSRVVVDNTSGGSGSGTGSGRPLSALPLVRSRPQIMGMTRRTNALKNGPREQQTRHKFTANML
jgi:hypothetical protein